jgi:putative endonuclease
VKQPVVYILASKPYGTLYIGVTSNLAARIEAHRHGSVDGFTKQYDVHTLVYFEAHADMYEAIQREKETQEVEPRMEDQADRGDESRMEGPLCGGVLNF